MRQARRSGLLARLSVLLQATGTLEHISPRARAHLESARVLSNRQQHSVKWEAERIQEALRPAGVPTVLLKGAAYVMGGLPCTRGRVFSDIDMLVPHSALPEVERALFRHGWVPEHLDGYDQRYYRQWMHELPPLRHIKRRSVLDVHHTILPPTARLRPDPRKLLSAAVPVEGYEDLYVLAPADMVLHSATHLFHDGELEHGLRDLVDLDDLLRHFGQGPDFWAELGERAREMDLTRPLFYALRYATRVLGTPVPEETLAAAQIGSPSRLYSRWMDALFLRALAPDHPSCADAYTGPARWLLYVRSHYLRMPLYLLIPHLIRKTVRRSPDH